MMNKVWSDRAWDDYLFWQSADRKNAKKINELVKDIGRNGLSKGIGKPICKRPYSRIGTELPI
jgi:toxin YoeB